MAAPEDRPDEKMAREVVAQSLGVQVCRHDDNSRPAMVDASIKYPDGRRGALEVVGEHDSAFYKLWKELEKVGHEIQADQLQHGWSVSLRHTARFRSLLTSLPKLLLDLEAAELGDLRASRRPPNRHLHQTAQAIGVGMAYIASHVPGGTVKLHSEGWSGTAGANPPLAQWVGDVLASNPDVAEKLATHEGVAERHAFIWATIGTGYAIQSGLELRPDADQHLDLDPPVLPRGVTHVWVAGSMSTQGAVAWSPERGWWRTPWRGRVI